VSAPTARFQIQTRRATVREWTGADHEAFRSVASDPRVMRYIGDGSAWTDEQMHAFIARQQDSVRQHGFCLGPLIENASGGLIGQAGLQYLGTTGDVEIGWWLAPHCWGRGLGTEVASAVLRFAFDTAKLRRVVAIAHPENLASIRIMQTIGMMFRGLVLRSELGLPGKDMEIVRYSAERPSKNAFEL
jgi:RimJ/RimL family protein N-acetyltransferase